MNNTLKKINHNDTLHAVEFYMNSVGSFMYVENNEPIEYFSRFDFKKTKDLFDEYITCRDVININAKYVLHFYQSKTNGIAHSIAKLSTYIRFITKYKGLLVIPDNTHPTVKKIVENIFDNVIFMQSNKKYVINNFIYSTYFKLMDTPEILKPDNKFPLIVYNNDIYWFRSFINRYVDFQMEKREHYKKIFVGKFEEQGSSNGDIQKPRTILGCIPSDMLKKFIDNGYVNIDPYNYTIHEVIYYIRHADEIILSCGTCGHLYAPYIPKTAKVYLMLNVIAEFGVHYNDNEKEHSHELTNNNEYSKSADTVLRFLNTYKLCYYEYHPHYDARVKENSVYRGKDMIDFLI